MLQTIVKIVSTVAIMLLLAPPVSAELTVGGSGAFYFGQYSTTEETDARESDGSDASEKQAEKSQFKNMGEAMIKLTYKKGPITAVVGLEKRSDEEDNPKLDEESYAIWQAADSLAIRIGRLVPLGANLGMSHNAGKSYALAGAGLAFSGLSSRVEDPGLEVKYNFQPAIYLSAGITSNEPLYLGTLFEDLVVGLVKSSTSNAVDLSDADYEGSGSGMYLNFFGAFSRQIMAAGAYVAGKADNFDGGPTYDSNGTAATVQFSFSDDFSIMVGFTTNTRNFATGYATTLGDADSKLTYNEMGLMVKKKEVGPGEIKATYGITEKKYVVFEKVATAKTEVHDKYGVMDVLYDLPLEGNVGVEFRLIHRMAEPRKTESPGTTSEEDAYTRTFVGLGLYASF